MNWHVSKVELADCVQAESDGTTTEDKLAHALRSSEDKR